MSLEFEHPYVATDMALFRMQKTAKSRGVNELSFEVLLTEQAYSDEKAPILALPGGFVDMEETLEENVMRKLRDKTGITGKFYCEQLYTKSDVFRDDRGRVISCSYLGVARDDALAGSLNNNSKWYKVTEIAGMALAFDHSDIIDYALKRMAGKALYTDIAFMFLPELFTIDDLSRVYALLLGKPVGNLRRRIGHVLEATEKYETGIAKRPALLHRRNNTPFLKE